MSYNTLWHPSVPSFCSDLFWDEFYGPHWITWTLDSCRSDVCVCVSWLMTQLCRGDMMVRTKKHSWNDANKNETDNDTLYNNIFWLDAWYLDSATLLISMDAWLNTVHGPKSVQHQTRVSFLSKSQLANYLQLSRTTFSFHDQMSFWWNLVVRHLL